jgi:hypothetical protein
MKKVIGRDIEVCLVADMNLQKFLPGIACIF